MGAKLLKIYDMAKAEGGLAMQMRLAMKTTMSSAKAGEAPDSPENIKNFCDAFKKITGKNATIN